MNKIIIAIDRLNLLAAEAECEFIHLRHDVSVSSDNVTMPTVIIAYACYGGLTDKGEQYIISCAKGVGLAWIHTEYIMSKDKLEVVFDFCYNPTTAIELEFARVAAIKKIMAEDLDNPVI